jgi:uncharacterized protein YecT (DUF1311 family)
MTSYLPPGSPRPVDRLVTENDMTPRQRAWLGRRDEKEEFSNAAAATVSGGYWYHRQRQAPAAQARDPAFQDQLMDRLAALTGVALF